ncbi:MAG: hypothetical protein JSS04_26760 [Proteobacteria bacterium]|nr:hypothetical protein [Pseudomonadota bacterium]
MSAKAKAALALAGLLAGCLQQPDLAYLPVSLPPPYSDLPDAPAGTAIEPGMPIKLDPREQEAVVAAVAKWMKEPGTASFGALSAVKAREGKIVVCGEVNGRNSAGAYPGMAPFVGVIVGKPTAPKFIVVSIAQFGQPRAEIQAICQQSGIF